MNKLILGLAAVVSASAATPSSAVTTVLDFSGNICGPAGNSGCSNGVEIGQSYGDSAIQNVSYRSFINGTGVTYEPYLKYWSGSYGNLSGVVWGGADGSNYVSEIVFTPAAGYEVSLTSFLAGCYQNRVSCRTFPYAVTTVGGAAITSSTLSPPNAGSSLASINSGYFSDGIVLRWGPDSYDGGLDNITFDVREIAAGGAVPEPASWALMLGGFGALGAALRRNRRQGVTTTFA